MKFGLSYFIFAEATKSAAGVVTYDNPFLLPGARAAKYTPNVQNTKYYADDGVWINDNSISDGTMGITTAQLSLQQRAKFYGHAYTAAVTTSGNEAPEHMVSSEYDEPQPMGHGYIVTRKVKDAGTGAVSVRFTGVWYNFDTFHESDQEEKTKEAEPEYVDEILQGDVEAVLVGSATSKAVGDTCESDDIAQVKSWLNTKAGYTPPSGGSGDVG